MRDSLAALSLLLPTLACSAPEPAPRFFFVEKGPYQAYYVDGRIVRLLYDANGDGKADMQTLYGPEATPVSAEVDTNHDAIVDRWEFFAPDGSVEKIGTSRLTPGRPDDWVYPERPHASPSAAGDHPASTAREAQDTDGRPDRWLVFEDGRLVAEELDTDGDGKPDRRLLRGSGGEITAIETDRDEDGVWEKAITVRR